jgi:hypothetical protein
MTPADEWIALSALSGRLAQNRAALACSHPALAAQLASIDIANTYEISATGDTVRLAARHPDGSRRILPNPLPASTARGVIARLAGGAFNGPIVVAGLDQGWLWDGLAKLSVDVPAAPGHTPPLFLLAQDLERLWVVLHLHDWSAALAGGRLRLFAGADAAAQLARFLAEHPDLPAPSVAATVDPTLWSHGLTLDGVLAEASRTIGQRVAVLTQRLEALYAGKTPGWFARRLASGERLRVLGITSRFTTFLQHSMRDWLGALESLGHETRLVIEQADHEKLHPLTYLGAIAEFQPDLVLLIDHYRAELPLVPTAMPAVMWVQDRLPNIFRPSAGAAQGPNDYVLGYGRRDCVTDHGYPRARFLESPVGVNETRFCSEGLTEADLAPHRADISFVSHASAAPERLIQAEVDRQPTPEARRLFSAVFDRLNAIYAAGGFVTQEKPLHDLARGAIADARVSLVDARPLLDFVTHKLNNAFFRHQVLHWLVDAGFEPALYGNGWERHPGFERFARGPADNRRQLAAVYRATRINLQVTPFGSAHQRLYEGLCAGGFFLLRKVTGDDAEPIYADLLRACDAAGVHDTDAFRRLAGRDPAVAAMLDRLEQLTGEHPLRQRHDFVDGLRALSRGGFTRMSSTLWPVEYGQVSFATRDELLARVRHFLAHADERAAIAESMRRRVLETVTYRGISRRLLAFVAEDLAARAAPLERAA